MKLYVYVLEAHELPLEKDLDEVAGIYAKLQLGKCKSRTSVVRKSTNPVWNEEFVFRVHDLDEELIIWIFHEDGKGDFLGKVQVPVWMALEEEKHTLPPTWFSLEANAGKSTPKDSGKILLGMSLYGRGDMNHACHPSPTYSRLSNNETLKELSYSADASQSVCSETTSDEKCFIPASEEKQSVRAFAGSLIQKLLNKNEGTECTDDSNSLTVSTNHDLGELPNVPIYNEDGKNETPCSCNFEEAIEQMQSRNEHEMPENLQGGVLCNQTYMAAPKDVNRLLFAPSSQFRKDLAKLQGTTDLQEGPWTWDCEEIPCLRRVVTYTNAATKLVKAVKASEEQTYLKADGNNFAVLSSVTAPDVPYGNCFKVEVLFRIMPGAELLSGEESAHLVISWNINFHHSTVMRGMIEAGARQGLKESYEQFADLLAQNIRPVDSAELLDKQQILASLQMEHQSDWDLAIEYFWNFTVVSTIFMGLYILLHILLSGPSQLKGLEFSGLDLPDSFGELIISGIFFLQGECVYNMISHFIQARLRRANDHGVKAQGHGWLLTVALIEGDNFTSMDSNVSLDPYVVFTCNGKTRRSSVKLHTFSPKWNEILEFDAMDEPPSVLDVEVFDFDAPFDNASSLGHAEINFLKHTAVELADMWVPLEGKLAQASETKLHLRIFLDNNKGVETIREYLTKMEKEVGKKLNLRSPHRNSTFQKLFGLPPEEFLISDFSCCLKRKMPLQGRIFLSTRIIGFYANLFGHKTKFFFLWVDIEDIQVVPPSLASVGSPTLAIILRKGRGLDARHGAKAQDEEGRLRFHFQSFVSFNVASRTIMALWRARTLTPEQKAHLAEDQQDQDERAAQLEDTGSLLGVEDANMLKIYSAELPVDIYSLMEIFDGGTLDHKLMEKVGCFNYTTTPWEAVTPDIYERHICYKFNRYVSTFGGEVTSTQQKSPILNGNGWLVDEVSTLQDVPFGDHFRVHMRYQIEVPASVPHACHCDVYIGIAWLKSTKFKDRITRNISEKFRHRVREIFELAEREIHFAKAHDSLT